MAAIRYFNSHAHVERDATIKQEHPVNVNFNSHAHVERDPGKLQSSAICANFNSHAHVERDYRRNISTQSSVNFNSHAHVERDGWIDNALIFRTISTHTLTWSVTADNNMQRFETTFQLTRSRGT